MQAARSWLYVPGDRPDRLAGAAGRGADALLVDLEDAVAWSAKAAARDVVGQWLAESPPADHGPAVWVRVNHHPDLLADDVAAVLSGRPPTGVVLPKADVDGLEALDALLGDTGLPVLAMVETARGVQQLDRIASAPRVAMLALGEADLAADLGLHPSPDARELMPLRLQAVVAAAAAGLPAPIGPVSTDFRDLEALRESSVALRRLGYRSRSCIHPAQVAVVNGVFTPTADEVAGARRLVELFDAAGGGACVDDDGRMVDEAVVRSARRLL